jgi:CheY-like chemotaxis protein
MMPGMNGIELASRLRAAHPKLPIVLMTGYSIVEIQGIIGEHHYRIIWKPFKTDSLLRMIDNALERAAGTTA